MSRNHFLPRWRCTAAAALLLLGAGAFAQGTTPPATPSSAAPMRAGAPGAGAQALDRTDRNFIENAAQGGMAEVALGQLAQQRAADAQVKTFADRMAQDHGKANDELMKLASAKSVQPPASPSPAQKREADRLSKLSGAEFDRAYMKVMVDDHKKTVASFQRASRSAKDAEVKAFATRTLPTLESHLQMAQSTYDGVRNAKGGAKGTAMPASR